MPRMWPPTSIWARRRKPRSGGSSTVSRRGWDRRPSKIGRCSTRVAGTRISTSSGTPSPWGTYCGCGLRRPLRVGPMPRFKWRSLADANCELSFALLGGLRRCAAGPVCRRPSELSQVDDLDHGGEWLRGAPGGLGVGDETDGHMADTLAARLTDADRLHYQTRGWVRLADVLTDRLEPLRAGGAHRLRSPTNDVWDGPHREAFPDGDQFLLYTAHGIHRDVAAWRDATTHPALTEAVADLLGVAQVAVAQSTIIVKPPTHGQAFPPHQDSVYYGEPDTPMLVALVHLDDTVPENGPIRYLDGSHLGGERLHVDGLGKRHLAGISLDAMTEVCAQAGDVVCAHLHTIHGSYPNRSDRARRLVRVVYRPAA